MKAQCTAWVVETQVPYPAKDHEDKHQSSESQTNSNILIHQIFLPFKLLDAESLQTCCSLVFGHWNITYYIWFIIKKKKDLIINEKKNYIKLIQFYFKFNYKPWIAELTWRYFQSLYIGSRERREFGVAYMSFLTSIGVWMDGTTCVTFYATFRRVCHLASLLTHTAELISAETKEAYVSSEYSVKPRLASWLLPWPESAAENMWQLLSRYSASTGDLVAKQPLALRHNSVWKRMLIFTIGNCLSCKGKKEYKQEGPYYRVIG